jgi:hypothetical protein
MPGMYTVDPERRLVLSRGWGVVTGEELLGHARTLAADPRFESSFRQLADLRDVTGLDFGLPTVREIARINPFGTGARRAIIIGNDLAYGVIQMYQMLRDRTTQEVFVFRELEPALEWLGLSADVDAIVKGLREEPPLVGG